MHICLDPSDQTLAFAGEELVKYLRLLALPSGSYSVSLSVDAGMGPADSYRYHFSTSGGAIAGSNSRSVLLGVYFPHLATPTILTATAPGIGRNWKRVSVKSGGHPKHS